MAHKIEQYDRQMGISQAWHGLTVVVPEITLENNWLTQWEIVPRELFFAGEIVKEKSGAVTRSVIKQEKAGFSLLGVSDVPGLLVGQAYNPETFKPIDNKAFLELVRASIAGTEHKIVSVGSVRNRGRVFLSIELNGMAKFKAAGRDFSAFLNFGNGHDKSSVLWVNTSNTCVVCDNTFGFNLVQVENKATSGDDIAIRQRHTKNASLKLPEIAKLIDKAVGVQGEFQVEFEKLAQVAINEPVAKNLFAGFIGRNVQDVTDGLSTRSKNTVSRLVELHKDTKQGNRGENLADAFSAITDFYTHESSGGENKLRQVVSSEYGSGMTAKAVFWNVVRNGDKREEMVKRGESLLVHSN